MKMASGLQCDGSFSRLHVHRVGAGERARARKDGDVVAVGEVVEVLLAQQGGDTLFDAYRLRIERFAYVERSVGHLRSDFCPVH
jgi:hypothetical protein